MSGISDPMAGLMVVSKAVLDLLFYLDRLWYRSHIKRSYDYWIYYPIIYPLKPLFRWRNFESLNGVGAYHKDVVCQFRITSSDYSDWSHTFASPSGRYLFLIANNHTWHTSNIKEDFTTSVYVHVVDLLLGTSFFTRACDRGDFALVGAYAISDNLLVLIMAGRTFPIQRRLIHLDHSNGRANYQGHSLIIFHNLFILGTIFRVGKDHCVLIFGFGDMKGIIFSMHGSREDTEPVDISDLLRQTNELAIAEHELLAYSSCFFSGDDSCLCIPFATDELGVVRNESPSKYAVISLTIQTVYIQTSTVVGDTEWDDHTDWPSAKFTSAIGKVLISTRASGNLGLFRFLLLRLTRSVITFGHFYAWKTILFKSPYEGLFPLILIKVPLCVMLGCLIDDIYSEIDWSVRLKMKIIVGVLDTNIWCFTQIPSLQDRYYTECVWAKGSGQFITLTRKYTEDDELLVLVHVLHSLTGSPCTLIKFAEMALQPPLTLFYRELFKLQNRQNCFMSAFAKLPAFLFFSLFVPSINSAPLNHFNAIPTTTTRNSENSSCLFNCSFGGVRLTDKAIGYVLDQNDEINLQHLTEEMKHKAFRKFMLNFEQNNKRNTMHVDESSNKTHWCRDMHGRMELPLYTDGLCQWEHDIYYTDAKVSADVMFTRLRKSDKRYYTTLGYTLKSNFKEYFNASMKLGCYNEVFKQSPNSCLLISETRYYNSTECASQETIMTTEIGPVENNENSIHEDVVLSAACPNQKIITGTNTLYRLQCCCQDHEKCSKGTNNPREFICPYDTRKYIIHGNSITQLNTRSTLVKNVEEIQQSIECLFMLLIRRNITEHTRVKSNATLDVEYGIASCNFDNVEDDVPCQDQRNLSVIQEFDMNQNVCCRTFLWQWYDTVNKKYNDSSNGTPYDPLALVARAVNTILYGKNAPDAATMEMSITMKSGMQECVYYRDFYNKICYFYYDNATGKSLTIEKGKNFAYLGKIGFDSIIINFHNDSEEECNCISVAGCKTTEINFNCNAADNTFLMCVCFINDEYYADYKLLQELRENRSDVTIYTPRCQIKAPRGNKTFESSYDKFFCYESFTPPNHWNRTFHLDDAQMGFYTDTSPTATFTLTECMNKTSKCKVDANGTYICCCMGDIVERKRKLKTACNKGRMLQKFIANDGLRHPKKLSSLNHDFCDDAISLKERADFMTDLEPLCYFSMKFSNASNALSQIKSAFYNTGRWKSDNIGIFSSLCNAEKWTRREISYGCACRIIDPLVPKYKEGKISSEISCCCVARYANNFKKVAEDTINNRFIVNKT
ncbi:hypothetical protein DdX_19129 [Ditylenchus destructor]|uniref:Uncharacterized protein n=1 Tax=Ditylenchus destructor TaxID=166010 RepID=A0AAD4MJQ2_9BILA|nr:hypothetical protein DdX_19129 [Ditylenchus destructor]